MHKVQGHDSLARDGTNSAILNTATSEYEAFMALYAAKKSTDTRIGILESQVQEQNVKLDLILDLLRKQG